MDGFQYVVLRVHERGEEGSGVWLSLARAPGLGPGGRRFESCHPDVFLIKSFIFLLCGCSSMVEHQPSKLDTWVRFPSPAYTRKGFTYMHEWLSGGVSPCQGEGRGFESRLVLFKESLVNTGYIP